jgi:hypothetical protein
MREELRAKVRVLHEDLVSRITLLHEEPSARSNTKKKRR